MKKLNLWKRTVAGLLSLLIVAGTMPANVGGFLTGGKGIVAKADNPNDITNAASGNKINNSATPKLGSGEATGSEEHLNGSGTENDPYLIGSLDDLNEYVTNEAYTDKVTLDDDSKTTYIKLTNDICTNDHYSITKNTRAC